MKEMIKTTGLIILAFVAIWMASANFVSWKTTFLASSDIGSTALVRLVDDTFGSTLSTWYRLENSLKKEDVINRLAINQEGALLSIPLETKKSALAHIDSMSTVSDGLLVSGWVFVPSESETAQLVVAVLGDSIVGVGEVRGLRADVSTSLGEEMAVSSGFSFSIPGVTESRKCDLKVFTLTQPLHLYRIPFQCNAAATEQVK